MTHPFPIPIGIDVGFQFCLSPDTMASAPITADFETIVSGCPEIPIIYHGKYIYNFSRRDIPNQISSLVHEMNWVAHNKASPYIIIHQGKNVASERMSKVEAINNYVTNITCAIDEADPNPIQPLVVLENSAGQGTELGATLDELNYIYYQFDRPVGICLDTCHLFASGELDVRNLAAVTDFFKRFNLLIGLENLKVIHFNDSNVPFNAHSDRHNNILRGYITNPKLGGNDAGLRFIAKLAHKHHIPLILEQIETNEDTTYVYDLIRQWICE